MTIPKFIHAHGCVSFHIVRHAPAHSVTELSAKSAHCQKHWRVEASIRLCSDDGQTGNYPTFDQRGMCGDPNSNERRRVLAPSATRVTNSDGCRVCGCN